MTSLPNPRGSLSKETFEWLLAWPADPGPAPTALEDSPEDAAVTLWTLHQLSYRGYTEVDEAAEWAPELVDLRVGLERDLESRLRDRWPGPPESVVLTEGFFDWVDGHDGPSLARYVQSDATEDQVRELLRVRSLYHLGEADPTAWVVPRLPTRAKAALVELQYDEYGAGRAERLHAHLFAEGLSASGIDPNAAAHVDEAPFEILEQNNALTMFGLHRRLRGAALGHLAAFEATSSLPSRRTAQGLERLGFPRQMVAYYTEHVEADAVHDQLAVRSICAALIEAEPHLEDDVWFGAWTCLDLEDRTARRLLDDWGVAA